MKRKINITDFKTLNIFSLLLLITAKKIEVGV